MHATRHCPSMMTSRLRWALVIGAAVAPAGIAVACGDGVAEVAATQGTGGAGAGASTGGAGGDGAVGGSTGQYTSGVGGAPTEEAPCAGKIYACGDLLDNDDDGLIDYQDPDCLGPCDDTEDHYHPKLPGWTGDACRTDCFWDNGNGPGNDDCYWDHHCDPLSVSPSFYPEGEACAYDQAYTIPGGPNCTDAFAAQSDQCLNYCAPLTPNGCDCFGCCELPAGGGNYVWLGSYDTNTDPTCTLADVADTSKCQPCTPVPSCNNGCAPCEYCLGKTELPPECFEPDGGTPEQCPPELQACGGPNQDPCPTGTYCITGCCVQLPE